MKEVLKKDIIEILSKTIAILEIQEKKDFEELKKLSDQAVETVALHKDLDIISITVLIYSIYKIARDIPKENYRDLLAELKFAKTHLEKNQFTNYNRSIRTLFALIKKSNVKVKEHLDDVMHASRIKKGAVLLKKGLSLGQAAGLMGLSNWDLQQYAGRTTVLEQHNEAVPITKRMTLALKIFGIK
jgi:hypothetical protein